jgi:hypothetical protein
LVSLTIWNSGKQIAHLLKVLDEDLVGDKSVQPSDIVDFIEHYTNKIVETYGLVSEDIPKLALMNKRAIYPRIYPRIMQRLSADIVNQSSWLSKQVSWLKEMGPSALKLDNKFFVNGSQPYEPAVAALQEISLQLVPIDMVVCVHHSISRIHDAAVGELLKQQQSSRDSALMKMGMDDVFPLFLWVVVMADVPCISECAYLMDQYSTHQEKISSLGWCTASLVAAITHLCALDQDNL